MAYNVLQSITIMTNMLRVFTDKCVAGITANPKRNEFYAQSTVSLATALNPYIGYAKAAEIAKESVGHRQDASSTSPAASNISPRSRSARSSIRPA